MLRHLLDHSSPGSVKYDTVGHDDYASHRPRAASTHDQGSQKIEEFPVLPSKADLKVSSFAHRIAHVRCDAGRTNRDIATDPETRTNNPGLLTSRTSKSL